VETLSVPACTLPQDIDEPFFLVWGVAMANALKGAALEYAKGEKSSAQYIWSLA